MPYYPHVTKTLNSSAKRKVWPPTLSWVSRCQVYLKSPGQVFLILKIQNRIHEFWTPVLTSLWWFGQASSGNAQAQPRIVAEVFHCSEAHVGVRVHCWPLAKQILPMFDGKVPLMRWLRNFSSQTGGFPNGTDSSRWWHFDLGGGVFLFLFFFNLSL